jgi:hypothetical protein
MAMSGVELEVALERARAVPFVPPSRPQCAAGSGRSTGVAVQMEAQLFASMTSGRHRPRPPGAANESGLGCTTGAGAGTGGVWSTTAGSSVLGERPTLPSIGDRWSLTEDASFAATGSPGGGRAAGLVGGSVGAMLAMLGAHQQLRQRAQAAVGRAAAEEEATAAAAAAEATAAAVAALDKEQERERVHGEPEMELGPEAGRVAAEVAGPAQDEQSASPGLRCDPAAEPTAGDPLEEKAASAEEGGQCVAASAAAVAAAAAARSRLELETALRGEGR